MKGKQICRKTSRTFATASATPQVRAEEREANVRTLPVWVILLAGLVVGLLVAILWRADIADEDIGFTVAGTILPGSTVHGWAVTNAWICLVFAIAAGLGTTFTACNCVVLFRCLCGILRV